MEAHKSPRIPMPGNSPTFANQPPRMPEQLADTQTLYTADGVHPNEADSRLAAESIAAMIQPHKETQT